MHKLLPILLLFISVSSFADVTTDELLKECEDKTIVMEELDGKLQAIGEKLGGFCTGYLAGFISASDGKICVKDKDPDFILSVLKTYIKNTNPKLSQPAGKTVSSVLGKIYKCK